MRFIDIFRRIMNLFKKRDGKKKDYSIRTVDIRFSDIPYSIYLVIKKYGWIALLIKSFKFVKIFSRKKYSKIKYLVGIFFLSAKRDGIDKVLKRTLSYIMTGSGVLDKHGKLQKRNKHLGDNENIFSRHTPDKNYRPKITVIVPNYNHEKYLEQRLDSIYSQTYQNFEVILLDDNSSDNSKKILLQYVDKYKEKTRCLFNSANSGSIFSQWKKGMAKAKGELIWIAESDDYCSSNFLSSLVKYFSDESVMLAYCQSVFMENGKKVWDMEAYLADIEPDKWKSDFVDSAHRIVNFAMAKKNIIPNVSSVIFRHPGNMYFTDKKKWESLRFCGDWVFYLHVMRGGTIAYTTKATNYYRQHESNTSTRLHADDVFYKEHEYVAKLVAELYNVSSKIFEEQRKMLQDYWRLRRMEYNEEAFKACYDIKKIIACQAKRKPNIAMFGFSFIAGGGETFPITLANLLYDNGYCVTFVDCDMDIREIGIRKMLNPSIPVIKLSDPQLVPLYMNSMGVEILHSHNCRVDSMINAMIEDMPLCSHVVTLHGMYEATEESYLKAILPKLWKRIDQWVYTTEKNLGTFKRFGLFDENKFLKIGNALMRSKISPVSRESLGINEDAFILCLVSRAIPEKGWEEAIRSVGEARSQSGRDIQLIIIGNGKEKERLQKQSPNYVHFLGFKSNIRDYYAMSDMGFMPSRFRGESFPLIIIDCLFSGKPILSSDIGEIKNMLATKDDKYAGALFSLVNWAIPEKELTALIIKCATDAEFYKKMLDEVETAAKKFDINNMFLKYSTCYNKVRNVHDAKR